MPKQFNKTPAVLLFCWHSAWQHKNEWRAELLSFLRVWDECLLWEKGLRSHFRGLKPWMVIQESSIQPFLVMFMGYIHCKVSWSRMFHHVQQYLMYLTFDGKSLFQSSWTYIEFARHLQHQQHHWSVGQYPQVERGGKPEVVQTGWFHVWTVEFASISEYITMNSPSRKCVCWFFSGQKIEEKSSKSHICFVSYLGYF